MLRYHRQMLLPQIGESGQNKILNSKVLVVGAGGLGHPVVQNLVGMGIGEVGIIDGDSVHLSNLHRQTSFREEQVGLNKAVALVDQLSKLNSSVKLISYNFYLDKKVGLNLFQNYDIVVDCSDNFETKYLINDLSLYFKKPWVFAGISQYEGQISTFDTNQGPCYRCLYPSIPKSKIKNCSELGVVGPLPGIIGNMQALEVLKYIVSGSYKLNTSKNVIMNCFVDPIHKLNPLIGTLLYFNFLNNEFISVKIKPNKKCVCQNDEFEIDQIEELNLFECSSIESCASLSNNTQSIIVDVREEEEWNCYHLEGTIHWPLSKLEAGRIPNHLKNKFLILTCISGTRASLARDILQKNGFLNLTCSERSIYEFEN